MYKIKKSLSLSLIIASVSFFNFGPVAAGGSSFSITEINPGSKVFQPGQKDQLLFEFTVNPTYVGDLKLKRFELSCGPNNVFESARLVQADQEFDATLMTENFFTHRISFIDSETIPKTTETLFQLKVDVKEGIDNTIVTCQTTAFEFEEIATGEIKKMPEYSYGGLSDDYSPIYIQAEDSVNINDKVSISQPGTLKDYPLGHMNATGANIHIEAGDQDIKVKALYALCDNTMVKEFRLMNVSREYRETPHNIELKNSQAVIFPVVNFTIPAHKREIFTLELALTSSHYTPYYKENKCAFTGITFSDEQFGKAIYKDLTGLGLENSESSFRVYDPKNITGFSDVPETHPHYEAIKFLRQFDIVDGFEDGTFKPDMEVKRSEISKLLYQASWNSVGEFWQDDFSPKNCFPDVKEEWFSESVCALKSKNWISGHPDGNFRPELTVNYAEALKMIFLSQGIEVEAGESAVWYAPYTTRAVVLGVFLPETDDFGKRLTRGEISELLYRTLKVGDRN